MAHKYSYYKNQPKSALIGGGLLFFEVFDSLQVSGISMVPTFSDSDHLFVLRRHGLVTSFFTESLGLGKNEKFYFKYLIRPGSIVVAIDPEEVGSTGLITKRIRAIGGESAYSSQDMKNHSIPENHVWLAGDNVFNSIDSRTFGPVHEDLIESYVFLWLSEFHCKIIFGACLLYYAYLCFPSVIKTLRAK